MSINKKKEKLGIGIFLHDLAPWLTELLSVSFFINLLALATPLFVLQVYDRVVFKASLTTLQGLLIGMAIVVLFDFVLKITRVRFFQSIAARNDMVLADKIYQRLFNLPLREMESKEQWQWQTLFQDAQLVRNALSGAPASLLIDLPFSVLFLLVIMIIAAPLWWIFIVAMALFVLLALIAQMVIRHRASREHQQTSEKERFLADLLKHRESVNLLALQDYWQEKWQNKQENAIEASMYRGRAVDFFRTLSQSLMIVFTVTVTSFGALAILEQEMTIGTLIAANMLGSRLIQPFIQLVEQWRIFIQFKQALKRLNTFINLPQNKVDSITDIPLGAGKISLSQLRFNYNEKENPAIDGLDGNIGPGGLHLLMGKNGSGKTSLLKLIAGLYPPAAGEVQLDDADLRQFTAKQLQQRIAYLPQRIEMFQSSIFENLQVGCIDCSEEQIMAMADKTGLHEQVISLPNGYDTMISDDNRGLSGGLIQRIALTRTLLGNPQIILLDEPNNNLDRQGELSLLNFLKSLATTHTIVVASHSQNLLANADSIVLLESGKVAIAGPAQAVLKHLGELEKQHLAKGKES